MVTRMKWLLLQSDALNETMRDEAAKISALSADDMIQRFIDGSVDLVFKAIGALIVFYIGKFIIKRLYNIVTAIMLRRDADQSLTTFVLSLVRIVLYFILLITIVGIMGLETSSFLAIFASAGVAVGMALSGTLQNFCRRCAHIAAQALQNRRLHRSPGICRHSHRDTDLPHDHQHLRQQVDNHPQRRTIDRHGQQLVARDLPPRGLGRCHLLWRRHRHRPQGHHGNLRRRQPHIPETG